MESANFRTGVTVSTNIFRIKHLAIMRKTNLVFFQLLVFTFLFHSSVFSQPLHIYYDAQTENVRYEVDGQEVKEPRVRKDQDIFVHVQNYNNYLYDLDVKANQKTIRITQPGTQNGFAQGGIDLSGLLMNFGGGGLFNMWNSGAGDSYNGLGDTDLLDGPGFAENTAEAQQMTRLFERYETTLKNMTQTEKRLQLIQKNIEDFKDSKAIKELVLKENEKIKNNPNLKPEQIRKLLVENLEKALEKKLEDPLSLEEIIDKSNHSKRLTEFSENLQSNHQDYKNQMNSLIEITDEMNTLGFADADFLELRQDALNVFQNSQLVEESIQNQKEELIHMGKTSQKEDIEQLLALRMEREALLANDFSYTYRTKATGDQMELNLEFKAKDSLGMTNSSRAIQVAPIQVPVFGGLKVNASVGISFGQYFERPQHYFLRDTIILARDMDSFTPYLSTFFHFYTQRVRPVSVGGTFGIGIPIGNATNQQSATFFLGPSIIIGKTQRIVINTGIVGGRVTKLDQGFKEGDVFRSDGDTVPIHHPYELGYFLGLSFNIGGN